MLAGLTFMIRSLGIAYNEVVVALLDEPGASKSLRLFTLYLVIGLSAILLLLAATPLAHLWFREVSGLSAPLADLARKALWFALPFPAMAVLQSWYQGAILHSRRTKAITEAVVIYLVSISIALWIGVLRQSWTGLYVSLTATSIAMTLQTIWLWWRSQSVLRAHAVADGAPHIHTSEHAHAAAD